jgi:Leucine-rich repeat (LRR) protein
MVGLVGQIPAGLEKLTNLRELNLEANSLTGELPKDLCSGGEWPLII